MSPAEQNPDILSGEAYNRGIYITEARRYHGQVALCGRLGVIIETIKLFAVVIERGEL